MPVRDLSQPIESGMPVYPGDPDVTVEPHATIEEDGYRLSTIRCGSHTGTHVDAPSHTQLDGATIDELPVEVFDFEALRVDLQSAMSRQAIGVDDLSEPTPEVDCLVLATGWDSHWGGTPTYHEHPYLTAEAASWCATRGLSVALDTASVDPTPPSDTAATEPPRAPAHQALLGAGCLIVENLTNLSGLPERFRLHVFPLNLLGGDGAPSRVVAILGEDR